MTATVTIQPAGVLDSSHATDSIILTGWVLDQPLEPARLEKAWSVLIATWPILVARLRRDRKASSQLSGFSILLTLSCRPCDGSIIYPPPPPLQAVLPPCTFLNRFIRITPIPSLPSLSVAHLKRIHTICSRRRAPHRSMSFSSRISP